MNKITMRRIGAGVATCLVMGGLIVGLPTPSSAASVTYTCTGATNDQASWEPQFFAPNLWHTSAETLSIIANSVSGFSPTPSLAVTVDASTPAAVAPGNPIAGSFNFTAALPPSLITAASGLGLSQVTVLNANFNVNAIGATPASITATLPSKVVPLTPGASVSQVVAGSVTPTVASGQVVAFKAGTAKLSVVMNVQVLLVTITTITLNCTPNDITLAQTSVVGGATTVAPTTAAPTTAAPTTAAPTTAAPTTAAPTTAAPTTAAPTTAAPTTEAPTTVAPTTAAPTTEAPTTVAPTTAAPTTAAPTTAAPTTAAPTTAAPTTAAPTTAPPQPGVDTANVRISGGYNYQNSGAVSGSGFAVASDGAGISGINGFGTLPGKNGGTASVAVSVNRFLWWSFGNITVNDPGAGISGVQAPLIFAPAPAGSSSAASVSAGWFSFDGGFKSYTIDLTVGDNG